ncbi:DUF695 domain-containing protein [Undibacterium sp. Di24W]|uniref:DUF695 domain-containing protein n=1 Tax=Undibacterium sp. Di24W TaxID=3413033 RepID=UPI003BF4B7DC
MKSKLLLLLIGCFLGTAALAQEWSTATSSNKSNGRVIIFRYVSKFASGFDRNSQPNRIIIAWKYQSEKGMPSMAERQQMDAMEDALQPILEKDSLATLALVSTGENLREWTYYVKSEKEFFSRLNKALAKKAAFPIDIHTAADPTWSVYEKFRTGVRE